MTGTSDLKQPPCSQSNLSMSLKRIWLRTVCSKSFLADHKYGHIREGERGIIVH